MNSDIFVKTFNTFFNPLAYKKILAHPDASDAERMLVHAGGLAAGYGSLAFVARKLRDLSDVDRLHDADASSSDYIDASFPTISADPNIDDYSEERSLQSRLRGEEVEKSASMGLGDKQRDPRHLALAVAATVGATGLGWRLADKTSDIARRKELDKAIEETQNRIDKLIFDEYSRVKGGVIKNASQEDKEVIDIVADRLTKDDRIAPNSTHSSIPNEFLPSPAEAWHASKSLYLLYAAAALSLAYSGSKKYFDKKDKKRRDIDRLQEIRNARSVSSETPLILDASSFENVDSSKGSTESPERLKNISPVSVGSDSKNENSESRDTDYIKSLRI